MIVELVFSCKHSCPYRFKETLKQFVRLNGFNHLIINVNRGGEELIISAK
jgi:hypothetical protein